MADALNLLFRISADSTTAKKELESLSSTVSKETSKIKKSGQDDFGAFRKSYESEMKSIESATKDTVLKLAKDFGFGAEEAAKLTSGLKLAGTAFAATAIGAVALAGGIFALVKSASDAGSEIYDLSVKTGVTAESLSAMKNAAEASGGSFQSIASSVGIFEKNQTAAEQGSKKMSATFKALGIDTVNVEKGLRDAFRALSQMPDGAAKTAAAMQLFGKSGKDVLGIIDDMNGDLDGAIEKYRQLGTLIDGETAAAADRFGDKLTELQQQLSGLGREIGMTLMPMVEDAVTSLSHWITDNKNTILDWAHTFAGAVQGVWGIVGPVLSALGQSLAALSDLMKAFQGDASAFKWKAAQFSQSLVPHVPTDNLTKEEQDFVDAEVEGKTLPVAGGNFGMSGADALIKGANRPKPKPPTLPTFGGGTKPKKVKGPEDFGKELLKDLENQYDSLGKKSDDLSNKTAFQRIQVELLKDKYSGLSPVLSAQIEQEARLVDARKAGLDVAEKTTKASDTLKKFLEKQTAEVERLTSGYKSNYDEGEKVLDSIERQGFQIQDITKDYIHLNALLLDTGHSMKALVDLKLGPDMERFGAGPSGKKGTDEGLAKQINDMMGGAVPPAATQTLDVFNEFSKVMQDTFGLGKEQAQEFGNILANTFGQVAGAVGDAVKAFILFGTAQGSFKKFAVEVIASVAQMAVVQAVFEAAQGLAMIALSYFTGNPKYAASAGAHFAAAAVYGLVGGAATLAGRGLAAATGYGKDENSASAGTSLQGGTSRNGSSSPQPVVAGRTAGGGNSRTGAVLEKLANAVDRLTAVSPGQVLMAGAQQAPHAITGTLRDDFRLNGITRQMIVDQRA